MVSLLLSLKNVFVHHNLSLSSLACSHDSELVPISLLMERSTVRLNCVTQDHNTIVLVQT